MAPSTDPRDEPPAPDSALRADAGAVSDAQLRARVTALCAAFRAATPQLLALARAPRVGGPAVLEWLARIEQDLAAFLANPGPTLVPTATGFMIVSHARWAPDADSNPAVHLGGLSGVSLVDAPAGSISPRP